MIYNVVINKSHLNEFSKSLGVAASAAMSADRAVRLELEENKDLISDNRVEPIGLFKHIGTMEVKRPYMLSRITPMMFSQRT